MPGKPQWPAVATPIADNTREHGFMLGMYIDTTLALMDEGHKTPSDTLKALFQTTLTFITKTKEGPNEPQHVDSITTNILMNMRYKNLVPQQVISLASAKSLMTFFAQRPKNHK